MQFLPRYICKRHSLCQGWHLAVWPGLAIGRLAKFGRPKWPKNLWPRPNANPFLISISTILCILFGQNLAENWLFWLFGHFGRPNWPKIFGHGQNANPAIM